MAGSLVLLHDDAQLNELKVRVLVVLAQRLVQLGMSLLQLSGSKHNDDAQREQWLI